MRDEQGKGIRRPAGPCQGCTDRKAEDPETGQEDCHRSCERYSEYKQTLAEYNKALYEKRKPEIITGRRPWLRESSEAMKEYRKEKKAKYRREAEHDRKE